MYSQKYKEKMKKKHNLKSAHKRIQSYEIIELNYPNAGKFLIIVK